MHWQEPSSPQGVHFLLGQLLERTTSTQHDVREMKGDVHQIKERLAHGDAQFAELRREMAKRTPDVSPWERWFLEAWRVGQFLLVLWLTGSIDAAVRMLAGAAK